MSLTNNNLAEYSENLLCIAICAAIAKRFSTKEKKLLSGREYAEKILHSLFQTKGGTACLNTINTTPGKP